MAWSPGTLLPARSHLLRRCCLLFALLWVASLAHADAVLLLEDPVNFEGRFTSVGHSAVWLTRVCSDDHVTVRRCSPEEAGAVVSRYPGLSSKQDWLAMPVGEYLFATDQAAEVPASISQSRFTELQAEFRRRHQGEFGLDPGEKGWSQLSGESYRRRIVLVRVTTTGKQDRELIAWLNRRRNTTRFNLFYPNCADFTGAVLGQLFPGAFHRSYLFDAGIMTPKQNLSSLHRYLERHPELPWTVRVLPQVSGDLPRSGRLRGITEAYLKSWWFMLPLDVLDPFELGAVTISGALDHRWTGKMGADAGLTEFFPGAQEVRNTSVQTWSFGGSRYTGRQ